MKIMHLCDNPQFIEILYTNILEHGYISAILMIAYVFLYGNTGCLQTEEKTLICK